MTSNGPRDHRDEDLARVAAGELAGGVCTQMVRPLRELREDLAVLVELLDRHIAESKGPRGPSYREVESMRQSLADCYLRCRHTARLASELSQATGRRGARGPVDLNKLVEAALNLARHRIAEDTEVFVDLGSLPMVRAADGDLLLVLSRLLCLAADSARIAEGSALSIKTRREDDSAVVSIADNGAGQPEAAPEALRVASAALRSCGGTVAGTSEEGKGSAFEIRMPIAR